MGDIYRGAKAEINAYNPHVVAPQISAAYIWVRRGNLSDLNNIQAGWAVCDAYFSFLNNIFVMLTFNS